MTEGNTVKCNLCVSNPYFYRPRKPFVGQGYTLGSPAPPVIGAPTAEDQQVNEQHARAALSLNNSRPITK